MPPPGHVDLVPRGRLLDRLDAGLRGPLTLVVAPAGSGKTSLLRSWRATEGGRATHLAWVALDDDDNDPLRFWRYVMTALEVLGPDIIEPAKAHLGSGAHAPQVEPAVIALINALSTLEQVCVLALDDYHVINAPRVHETLTFLIERMPACLRLLLAARADPALPLARWRARGLLSEIRIADLRFSVEEAQSLLGQVLDAPLTPSQLALLTERTEGWAAGLRLAGLALRGRSDADAFLDSFTGSHQFIMTYLIEDVLSRQPEWVQEFLIATSILGQLNGELCDALTGRDDGAAILAGLARDNLFTLPLDDEGHWYRYHQLFAGVLHHRLRQLAPQREAELHARAARWYEQHGLLVPAVDHAFRSGDNDEAARIIADRARIRRDVLATAGATTAQRWLDRLPEEIVLGDPRLCITAAWIRLISGPLDEIDLWLDHVEQTASDDPTRGEAAAIRSIAASFRGNVAGTIGAAETARRLLAPDDAPLRGVAAMGLGQAQRFDGRLREAESAYREAAALGLEAGNLYVAIDSLGDLGLVVAQQGQLREAERVFEQAQQILQEQRASHLTYAGAVYVIWPEVLRERNEPQRAAELAQRGIDLGRQGAKVDLLITGWRSLGKARWSLGDLDGAQAAVAQALTFAREYGVSHTARALEALLAHLALARGDKDSACAWAERISRTAAPLSVLEAEAITALRVQVAQGSIGDALERSAPLLAAAHQAGRVWSALTIRAIRACALDLHGERDAALDTLGHALRQAAPEGFVRVFLDEGPPMLRLLRRAVDSGVETVYAATLLDAAGETTPASAAPNAPDTLIDPLSDREQDVLRLLAAGLSSPEIAGELYVSASTVRSHLKSIYRKLDVHSRDQAIARASDLRLV
jgi:LuxR family transcriptional regulator, maltose regulon positive regulatory protein